MISAARIEWPKILVRAAAIVRSYATSVTLRQLFYRLVSSLLLPNTEGACKTLSKVTAEARRAGTFPDLIDRGRQIHRRPSWDSPESLIRAARDQYCLDRTKRQNGSVYVGVEALASFSDHLTIEPLADWPRYLGDSQATQMKFNP